MWRVQAKLTELLLKLQHEDKKQGIRPHRQKPLAHKLGESPRVIYFTYVFTSILLVWLPLKV